MSVTLKRNIESYLVAFAAQDNQSILAGGAADGVAQTGNSFDRLSLDSRALSAAMYMTVTTVGVDSGDNVTVAYDVEDSADNSAWANFGPVITTFATPIDTNASFIDANPIDLAGARRYIRVNLTTTLAASATDTADVSLSVVMSGFAELPVT